jgi:two-component system nitrate/nitrite response regulator NarL
MTRVEVRALRYESGYDWWASVVWERRLLRDLCLVGQGNNGCVGSLMESKLATIVVESRLLIREALKSMMAKNSCRVVCDIGSIAEMNGASALPEGPKLVILGPQSADNALSEAVSARKLWPDSRIILLYEHLSPADFQKLLMSEINGCVPLFASSDTLVGTLDMIVTKDIRVMVVGDAKHPVIQAAQSGESHPSEIRLQSDGTEHEDVSVSVGALPHRPMNVPAQRNHPGLSEREIQMLDGLVKGHANKVIARACEITEATVKVHMKSILRKIRVENRTQAAIWAMANGYAADGSNSRRLNPDSARNAAAITEAAIGSVATSAMNLAPQLVPVS